MLHLIRLVAISALISHLLGFAPAAAAEPEALATFNGFPEFSLVRRTPTSSVYGSRGGVVERSPLGMVSTVGASDFHIVYDPVDGYRIMSIRDFPGRFDRYGFHWSASLYPDALLPFRSGIRIDLQSPRSVLHFDGADLKAEVSFKLLEVVHEPTGQVGSPRYLRVLVTASGEVVPLDWSRTSMAELAESVQGSGAKESELLKKALLKVEVNSSKEVTISANFGSRARVQISAGAPAQVLDAGLWRDYSDLWAALEEKSHGQVKRPQVIRPSNHPTLRSRNERIRRIKAEYVAAGLGEPAPEGLRFLRPIQSSSSSYAEPTGEIRDRFESALRDALLRPGPVMPEPVTFQWSRATEQELNALFHAYTEAGTGAILPPLPLHKAYFIDHTELGGSDRMVKVTDDLADIRDHGRPFVTVVRNGDQAQITYFFPGSGRSLDEAFTVDPLASCRIRLMHAITLSRPYRSN